MQDFYNLVDVYLDAVLHPNCINDEHTFAQEGWHYELEDPKVFMLSAQSNIALPVKSVLRLLSSVLASLFAPQAPMAETMDVRPCLPWPVIAHGSWPSPLVTWLRGRKSSCLLSDGLQKVPASERSAWTASAAVASDICFISGNAQALADFC